MGRRCPCVVPCDDGKDGAGVFDSAAKTLEGVNAETLGADKDRGRVGRGTIEVRLEMLEVVRPPGRGRKGGAPQGRAEELLD